MTTSPAEPLWPTIDDIIEVHEEQIELRGGPHGIRDLGLVESALGRAQQLHYVGDEGDILVLAVRLGIGLAANHGFIDGNKRAGAFMMIEFLGLNGYRLDLPDDLRLGQWFEAAVAKEMSEADLIAALDAYIVEID
ncbi:MAG TPA: type II toxin-antitoxin system death-on-curing family toxin [Allosphingosinicella sp.]